MMVVRARRKRVAPLEIRAQSMSWPILQGTKIKRRFAQSLQFSII
jgi:hypothetical protein